jgi:hypothetical protein
MSASGKPLCIDIPVRASTTALDGGPAHQLTSGTRVPRADEDRMIG